MAKSEPIPVTAVWLRTVGDDAEVLLEIDGVWRRAITDTITGPISWIAEARGLPNWPVASTTDKEG